MTAASGVPPWARPVLEKVLMVSHMMARSSEYTPDLMRDAWESLHMAVRAALASDAGTVERFCLYCGRTATTDVTAKVDGKLVSRFFCDECFTEEVRELPVTAKHAKRLATASDAGTPEKEPFFHKLGCPQISGTTAHCTCQTPEGVRVSADGAPPWARPVLEELRGFADAAWRGLASQDRVTAAWAGAMRDACTAALAADAGTPEGERVEGWTGKPGPCPNCGAIRNERDAHFCSSTRSAPAPLAESGAAAPTATAPEISMSLVDDAPDAELDSLLTLLCGYEYDRGVADYVGDAGAVRDHTSSAVDTIAAIHAHVERMKREARDVESGWLIERTHPGGPIWAAIPDPQLAHYLIARLRTAIVPTSDATRALRFAREADAEAFRLANLSEWADTRSTEHVFLPPTATPEAPDAHP